MKLPQELVLLRHGQSVGNAAAAASRANDHSHYTPGFRITDPIDWQLTDAGRSQARTAGEWMEKNGLGDADLNLSSKMRRAIQTAELAQIEEFDDFFESHLLNERNWGIIVSLPHNERLLRDLGTRDANAFHWQPPGGESMSHVIERLQVLMKHMQVYHTNPKRIRIRIRMVYHGEVMWAWRYILEGMTPEQYNKLHLDRTPQNMIYNCHLLHYRDLQNGRYQEMRSVCTYNPKRYDSGWIKINVPLAA